MKKYRLMTIAVLILSMVFYMASCGNKELSDKVRVGALVGPTGMGLIELVDEDKIEMNFYQSPTDAVQKLISGDIDVACLPSNMGALLNAKTEGNIRILSNIVNGGLYVIENGGEIKTAGDLSGRTIIASGKGGTPEYVLQAVLENAGLDINSDVRVEWLEDHAAVAQKVAATKGAVGLLPQPMVASVTAANPAVRTAINMRDEWKLMTGQDLPMGVIVARKDLVESRPDDVNMLLDMVMDSITEVQHESEEVVQKIVDAGIIGAVEICKAAIDDNMLVCYSTEDTRDILTAFYNKLYKMNPVAVGGSLPDDSIYFDWVQS